MLELKFNHVGKMGPRIFIAQSVAAILIAQKITFLMVVNLTLYGFIFGLQHLDFH